MAAIGGKAVILADTIESAIITAMRERRIFDIQGIVEAVGQNPDIERVWIFNDKGVIRFSSVKEEIGLEIDPERFAMYMAQAPATVFEDVEWGRRVHAIVKPIRNRPECYGCHDPTRRVNGILHVDLSFAKAKAHIASVGRFILLSALLTIASLSLALGILLSRLVSRPVSRLIETMEKVEQGDLSARVTAKSGDELGRLGRSFNEMISRLQEASRQLETEHQQQLEQAEKMASLGQLASAIAHEVKNPLAGMSGAMEILAEDYPPDEPKREVIEEMLREIRRLDKTVKDFLSYARPASPEPVLCNVSDLVESALFFIRQQVRGGKVSVVTNHAENLPQVLADCQQVQQVFLNVALNSIQAMPEGGTLTVTTSALSHLPSAMPGASSATPGYGFVEVAISDTGAGISPENLKKVFRPFYTTKHRGTGLGLAICRRIVEQHGGTIRIESELGKGTTVRIALPVQAKDTARTQDDDVLAAPRRG